MKMEIEKICFDSFYFAPDNPKIKDWHKSKILEGVNK